MIPHVPPQRQNKFNASQPFDDLLSYIKGDLEKEQGPQLEPSNQFDYLLDYATASLDKKTNGEKCIAIRTHGVAGLTTASVEMNAVARENKRCTAPVYHIILSWPEHEQPSPDSIFDAAEHALSTLGLAEHQYVIAIHGNTDNMHCHISVNKVHPITFKSQHIEWATKTLHMAARQSEIKHGWSHDNGIYVVEVDGHGKKHIVLNPENAAAVNAASPHAHKELGAEELLPTWHDPDSLDAWLKGKISKALKQSLPELTSWHALHVWLDKHSITLSDSGGGGMRLKVTSPDTGELVEMAASRGLRLLKRTDLEKRWGPYKDSYEIAAKTPDLSNLSPTQILEGINHVINNTLEQGTPPEHVIRAQQRARRLVSERAGGLHELPAGGLDVERQTSGVLLQNALHDGLGDQQAGANSDVRRAGTIARGGGSQRQRTLNRDNSKREERKALRAAARKDLRNRFAQYRRLVQLGDSAYFARAKEIRSEFSATVKAIRAEAKAARATMPRYVGIVARAQKHIEIDARALRQKLEADARYQTKTQALKATHTPALGWRIWLHEQSQLGDQAALSALRGIVYQAQRDAKRHGDQAQDDAHAAEYSEAQFRKFMARLLEEEKKEAAIRAASLYLVRPYEADALLKRYVGIQWKVTGNGNIEYQANDGGHLFTDRGNRVTFDRARVTDDEIRLALMHAQHKFGNKLTLTGDDTAFSQRMAHLAEDLGITILNPELQFALRNYREQRRHQEIELQLEVQNVQVADKAPTQKIAAGEPINDSVSNGIADRYPVPPSDTGAQVATPMFTAPEERLRALVLSIDPLAKFELPDPSTTTTVFHGPVVVILEDDAKGAFAQHIGRGKYAIHPSNNHRVKPADSVEVHYHDGQVSVTSTSNGLEKGMS